MYIAIGLHKNFKTPKYKVIKDAPFGVMFMLQRTKTFVAETWLTLM